VLRRELAFWVQVKNLDSGGTNGNKPALKDEKLWTPSAMILASITVKTAILSRTDVILEFRYGDFWAQSETTNKQDIIIISYRDFVSSNPCFRVSGQIMQFI
jgi:hypothetical protein